MLVAHIARTANVCATDPGLPVSEVQRTLGVNPVSPAAVATAVSPSKQSCSSRENIGMGSSSFLSMAKQWFFRNSTSRFSH